MGECRRLAATPNSLAGLQATARGTNSVRLQLAKFGVQNNGSGSVFRTTQSGKVESFRHDSHRSDLKIRSNKGLDGL